MDYDVITVGVSDLFGRVATMSLHSLMFSVGCGIAWFVLLPLLVVGGGIALLSYAVFAEAGAFFIGRDTPVDTVTARENARRLCWG